jgi:hypothetical protein
VRRGPWVVAAGLLLPLLGVAPAAAHTLTGVPSTDYRSRITSVSPRLAGLSVRLLDLGRRVRVTNRTGADVVVVGYQGEPYLRVGPAGVFENRRSPTLYLNRGLRPAAMPASADPTAPPSWHRRGSGRRVTWPDSRTRWTAPDPPAVRADRGRGQVVVPSWRIELRAAGRTVAVTGTISYLPPPSAIPYLLVAGALLAGAVAAAGSRWWGPALSAGVAVLVAVDVVRSVGGVLSSGDGVAGSALRLLLGGILSVAAWVAGALAVGRLQAGEEDGAVLGGVAAFVIFVYSGVGDLANLSRSQVPFAWPVVLARVAVAVSLGLGGGVTAGAALAFHRLGRPAATGRAAGR